MRIFILFSSVYLHSTLRILSFCAANRIFVSPSNKNHICRIMPHVIPSWDARIVCVCVCHEEWPESASIQIEHTSQTVTWIICRCTLYSDIVGIDDIVAIARPSPSNPIAWTSNDKWDLSSEQVLMLFSAAHTSFDYSICADIMVEDFFSKTAAHFIDTMNTSQKSNESWAFLKACGEMRYRRDVVRT